MKLIKNQIAFLKEGLLEFKSTGSLFPTSTKAALAMLAPLRSKMTQNCRILEVGPGTGSITKHIIPLLQPGMTLTICEINPNFMQYLKTELEQMPDFQARRGQIEFFLGPVQDLSAETQYDLIVCALPFLNFPIALLEEIFEKLINLSHNNTLMSFYQYMGLKRIRDLFSGLAKKQASIAATQYIERQVCARQTNKSEVWFNILPICVYTLNMNPEIQPALSPCLTAKSTLANN